MKRLTLVLAVLLIGLLASGCGAVPETPKGVSLYTEAGVDPDAWALVPAGEFLSGQYEEVVNLDYDYEIKKTPVTNAQYAQYLTEALAAGTIIIEDNEIKGYYPGDPYNGGKHEVEINEGYYIHMPLGLEENRIFFDGQNFTVKAGYENHPVTMVTWFGAKAYADFYSWRLPSDHEWEKAARGTDGRPFPWGDEITYNHANFYKSGGPFQTSSGYSDTTPVGFYNGSTYGDFKTYDAKSPYGVYDMAGNVQEWTGTLWYQLHDRKMWGANKQSFENYVRIWKYDSATPTYYSPNTGFRVARDAE